MPEQQKVDETIESTKRLNKKKLSKIDQSATSLENEKDDVTIQPGLDDDNLSISEIQDEELKEQPNQ